jgi:hypothetical protein
MEEYPQAVIDKVLGELDTHKGLIAFDVETVKLKFRKIEVTIFVSSTTCRARRKLFQVVAKRTEYPAEVFCEAIKTGYRICDSSRSLRSCLLTQCKSAFAKEATAGILEVEKVTTLFKEKK